MADLKVAICGKAPSSIGLAPYDDPSWECWTLSNLIPAKEAKRFDRHFELHDLNMIKEREDKVGYWEWLKQDHGKPIYLIEPHPDIPSGVVYPRSEIVKKFGSYFTNQVSWMLALAIHEGCKAMGLYGVDMAQAQEYAYQRPSCEWLIGWAQGAGVEVTIPEQSDLLKCAGQYGFDSNAGSMLGKWQARTKELQARVSAKERERDQATVDAAYLQGALASQEYYRQWL